MEQLIIITGMVIMLVVLSFAWVPKENPFGYVLVVLAIFAAGCVFILGVSFIIREMYWLALAAGIAAIVSFREGLLLSRKGPALARTAKHTLVYEAGMICFFLYLPLGSLTRS